MSHVTLEIKGMSCNHCVMQVERALTAVSGVTDHQVALGAASVSFDEAVTSVDTIAQAVTKAGYDASAHE